MAIPEEYKLEEIVRKTENLILHRANHPIHGKVFIYLPDDSLPSNTAVTVKRSLYQNGIRMRNISQLQLPFVTRILEVSQNPNEPYIITEYTRYDLEELIDKKVKLQTKRIFQVFSHVLQAIVGQTMEGHRIEHLNARQIRLKDPYHGNATFTPLENAGTGANMKTTTTSFDEKIQTNTITIEGRKKTESAQNENVTCEGLKRPTTPTVTIPHAVGTEKLENDSESTQRNIYLLGNMAYQLLFGDEYHLSDNNAATNINKLGGRWRKIINNALSPSLDERYETYEAMLRDINRALSRNKKITIASIPVFILLAAVGIVFGYNQYRRHKIMTSEAGRAIENFLNVVNQTNDEFPPPLEYSSSPAEPNDDAILKPFDEIPKLTEE